MQRTYLQACLKSGRTVRWPDSAMPLLVYVAPFTWYEKHKKQQAPFYQQMVLEAMAEWTRISNQKVRFKTVTRLQDSQINIAWRRVDRRSLGHCEFMINKQGVLYSAEIQIGISDGMLHAQYNDVGEVRHTILHEFGHAIGLLDHSDHPDDMMYVPHQYGVTRLSERDGETVRTLYTLPMGFDYLSAGAKLQLPPPFTLDDVLAVRRGEKKAGPATPQTHAQQRNQEIVLQNHHDILTQQGKFFLATQNIAIPEEVKKRFIEEQRKKKPS